MPNWGINVTEEQAREYASRLGPPPAEAQEDRQVRPVSPSAPGQEVPTQNPTNPVNAEEIFRENTGLRDLIRGIEFTIGRDRNSEYHIMFRLPGDEAWPWWFRDWTVERNTALTTVLNSFGCNQDVARRDENYFTLPEGGVDSARQFLVSLGLVEIPASGILSTTEEHRHMVDLLNHDTYSGPVHIMPPIENSTAPPTSPPDPANPMWAGWEYIMIPGGRSFVTFRLRRRGGTLHNGFIRERLLSWIHLVQGFRNGPDGPISHNNIPIRNSHVEDFRTYLESNRYGIVSAEENPPRGTGSVQGPSSPGPQIDTIDTLDMSEVENSATMRVPVDDHILRYVWQGWVFRSRAMGGVDRVFIFRRAETGGLVHSRNGERYGYLADIVDNYRRGTPGFPGSSSRDGVLSIRVPIGSQSDSFRHYLINRIGIPEVPFVDNRVSGELDRLRQRAEERNSMIAAAEELDQPRQRAEQRTSTIITAEQARPTSVDRARNANIYTGWRFRTVPHGYHQFFSFVIPSLSTLPSGQEDQRIERLLLDYRRTNNLLGDFGFVEGPLIIMPRGSEDSFYTYLRNRIGMQEDPSEYGPTNQPRPTPRRNPLEGIPGRDIEELMSGLSSRLRGMEFRFLQPRPIGRVSLSFRRSLGPSSGALTSVWSESLNFWPVSLYFWPIEWVWDLCLLFRIIGQPIEDWDDRNSFTLSFSEDSIRRFLIQFGLVEFSQLEIRSRGTGTITSQTPCQHDLEELRRIWSGWEFIRVTFSSAPWAVFCFRPRGQAGIPDLMERPLENLERLFRAGGQRMNQIFRSGYTIQREYNRQIPSDDFVRFLEGMGLTNGSISAALPANNLPPGLVASLIAAGGNPSPANPVPQRHSPRLPSPPPLTGGSSPSAVDTAPAGIRWSEWQFRRRSEGESVLFSFKKSSDDEFPSRFSDEEYAALYQLFSRGGGPFVEEVENGFSILEVDAEEFSMHLEEEGLTEVEEGQR